MQVLLADLLELTKIGRTVSRIEDFSMQTVTEEVIKTLSIPGHSTRERIHIVNSLPTIRGDRNQLMLVMQNLLENALKFCGERTPSVEIDFYTETTGTVFVVRDRGMGIEPRYHDRIFTLFERLDNDESGTGVGLALVKRIIEHHNGRLWVESSGIDTGTTFYFMVPS